MEGRKHFLTDLLGALLSYVLLIFRVGYYFGDGDQEEVLGQILYKLGNAGLANDFLVSSVGGAWTVRTPFVFLMTLFGESNLEFAFIAMHILVYVAMLYFMIRICRQFVNTQFALLTPLIAVVILYAKSPGANDLYSGHLIAESLSVLMATLALYYWLKDSFFIAGIGLLLGVLFHPLNGIQVFLLLLGASFLANRKEVLANWKSWSLPFTLSFIYIFWLQVQSSSGGIGSELYFSLLVKFRNPHHYLPSHFPIEQIIGLLVMMVLVGLIFRKKNGFVRNWILLTLIGLVIFSLGAEMLENTMIVKTQWFKTTIWVRMWFAIACIYWLDRLNVKELSHTVQNASLVVLVLIAIYITAIRDGNSAVLNWKGISNQSLLDISEKCEQELEADALFIQPIGTTGFQYASKKPLFVSFKSVLHYPVFFAKWHGRLIPVYGELDTDQSGFNQFGIADSNYHNPQEIYLSYLKGEGVDYMLTTKQIDNPSLEIVFYNEDYWVYKLKPPLRKERL